MVLLSALLNAVYFGRVLEIVWFKTDDESHGHGERGEHERGHITEVPTSMALPPFILVAFSIIFGIAAVIPVSMAEQAAGMLLGGQ